MNEMNVVGVSIRQDVEGRFCLNDLHKAAGGESRHQPGKWLENPQTIELIAELEKTVTAVIFAKQGLGTFVAKELVYGYAMWISPVFHLKVIRAYDAMMTEAVSNTLADKVQASAVVMRTLVDMLNLEGSAKLGLLMQFTKAHAPELLPALPVYATDAPPTETAGSSRPTKSATDLLREHGVSLSAKAFNKLAESHGFLEQLERRGSKGVVKTFWNVTDSGSAYGKNVTSPVNPRETQAHWYIHTFGVLLVEMGVVSADQEF